MKKIMLIVVVLLVIVVAFATVKRVSPLSWGLWGTTNTTEGIALNGFDAVSYFEADGPLAGSENFSAVHADASWYFATAANRDLFAAEPEKYSPQFGGFCAFAASKGFTAHPAPEAWHIEDGALYVFADEKVRDEWVAELPGGSLQRSQENWAKR
jgi:hypothetical protein